MVCTLSLKAASQLDVNVVAHQESVSTTHLCIRITNAITIWEGDNVCMQLAFPVVSIQGQLLSNVELYGCIAAFSNLQPHVTKNHIHGSMICTQHCDGLWGAPWRCMIKEKLTAIPSSNAALKGCEEPCREHTDLSWSSITFNNYFLITYFSGDASPWVSLS